VQNLREPNRRLRHQTKTERVRVRLRYRERIGKMKPSLIWPPLQIHAPRLQTCEFA
jgi:hypothetical protein